jgi:hypothetical protein
MNMGGSYTSGGTGVVTANLNRKSTKLSAVTTENCFYGDDLTLTTPDDVYINFVTLANTPFREEIANAMILGQNDSVSLNISADAGLAFVSIKYFEKISE